ncbi:homoserine O-acetyltransferase [Janthinobacterium sp. 17J80-10]|uniref:E22 family MetX-like putative esterase n=1 Tax=Janthinobacterium sp. 17J80-10 TaxID=2497863 RepID=UPI0010054A70|nr:homoserine O-acetyltransferase [Janthinobacterium sp. 17J80-10]QAU33765.1 homoserine O-acetyltransferase [Janthinobacterium sp. 17J80-10]
MQAYNGLVEKQSFTLPSYTTVGGREIKDLKVGWESYGQLNAARDNAILVPHYYSANSHVAGRYQADDAAPGYWDSIIGPGKPLDTDRYFVISVDALVNMNSKDGITVTTGPASTNPATGKPYGLDFPVVTIRDFVRVQRALLDSLGIVRLVAAAGVSMGALQSYEWAAAYPEMVERVIAVNGTPTQKPYAICNLESWISPIKADANWNNGNYYGGAEPLAGVTQAMFNVIVAALHADGIAAAFQYQWADAARSPLDAISNNFLVNQAFQANCALRAQTMVDANHMLYMTRANQLFVAGTPGSSVDPELKNIQAKTLVVQYSSDTLFPVADAAAQVARLKENGTAAELVEIASMGGHLAGVTEIDKASEAIRGHLAR